MDLLQKILMARRPASTVQSLYRNLVVKPHDRLHWGLFADALDDAGFVHTARVARYLSSDKARATSYGPNGVRPERARLRMDFSHPSVDWMIPISHPESKFSITSLVAGIPMTAHLDHGFVQPETDRQAIPYGSVHFTTSQGRLLGAAKIPVHELHGVMTEAKPYMGRHWPRSVIDRWYRDRETIAKKAALHTPEQMARPGQPVRFDRGDHIALANAIKAEPHNPNHWAGLADSFREHGLEHWANLISTVHQHGQPSLSGMGGEYLYHSYIHPELAQLGVDPNGVGGNLVLEGDLHGLPASVRLSNYTEKGGHPSHTSPGQYYSDERFFPQRPMVGINLFTSTGRQGEWPLFHAVVPAEHAQGLMKELHGLNQGMALGHTVGGSGAFIPKGQRRTAGVHSILSRRGLKLRFSLVHRPAFLSGIAAAPRDDGPKLVYADSIEERLGTHEEMHGDPHVLAVLRHGQASGFAPPTGSIEHLRLMQSGEHFHGHLEDRINHRHYWLHYRPGDSHARVAVGEEYREPADKGGPDPRAPFDGDRRIVHFAVHMPLDQAHEWAKRVEHDHVDNLLLPKGLMQTMGPGRTIFPNGEYAPGMFHPMTVALNVAGYRRHATKMQRILFAIETRSGRQLKSVHDVIGGTPAGDAFTEGLKQKEIERVHAMWKSMPASHGFTEADFRGHGLKPGGAKAEVAAMGIDRGVSVPDVFTDPGNRAVPVKPVAEAMQAFSRHEIGPDVHAKINGMPEHIRDAVWMGLAYTNGLDEVTHQLQKGLHHSGAKWYGQDLHEFDRGLMYYFGKPDGKGNITSPFGTVNRDGQVVHVNVPHLNLFKMVMAPMSYGQNPVMNLMSAIRAYKIARIRFEHATKKAHQSGKPLPDSVYEFLPEHSGILEAPTGDTRQGKEWAYHSGQEEPYKMDPLFESPYLSKKVWSSMSPAERAGRLPTKGLSIRVDPWINSARMIRDVIRHYRGAMDLNHPSLRTVQRMPTPEQLAAEWFLNPQKVHAKPGDFHPGLADVAVHGNALFNLHPSRPRGSGHKSHASLKSALGSVEGRKKEDAMHHGAFVLGPKGGAFALNINSSTNRSLIEHITKDLWFSRSWNRILGTLLDMKIPHDGDDEDKSDIQETPRGPAERARMDRVVEQLGNHFSLTPAEVQAVWWYYEQGLWRAFGARNDSYSYIDAINMKLATRHVGKMSAPIDPLSLPTMPMRNRTRVLKKLHEAIAKKRKLPSQLQRIHFSMVPNGLPTNNPFIELAEIAEQLIRSGRMPEVTEWLRTLFRHVVPQDVRLAMKQMSSTPRIMAQFARVANAVHVASSTNAMALAHALAKSLNRVGLAPNKVSRAILNAAGDFHPAAVASVYAPTSDPTAIAAAGWHGLLARLPGVVAFIAGQGPDVLHRIHHVGPMEELAARLTSVGAHTHTVIPGKNGSIALVYDPGGKMTTSLLQSGLDVASASGRGVPIAGRSGLRDASRMENYFATDRSPKQPVVGVG